MGLRYGSSGFWRPGVVIGAAALALWAAVAVLPAPASAHRIRIPVDEPVSSVEVRNTGGSVSIRPGASSYVDYVSIYRVAPPTVTVTPRDGHLEVDASCPEDEWGLNNCQVDLYIRVPAGASVDAAGHVFGIAVSEMRSSHILKTTSGQILVRDANASLIDASSTTGTVTIENSSAAEVSASTTKGLISVDRVDAPRISSESTTGDISLRDVNAAQIRSESTVGDIAIDDATSPDHVAASATSGDVRIGVPSGRYALSVDTRQRETEITGIVSDQSAPRRIEVSTTSGRILLHSR